MLLFIIAILIVSNVITALLELTERRYNRNLLRRIHEANNEILRQDSEIATLRKITDGQADVNMKLIKENDELRAQLSGIRDKKTGRFVTRGKNEQTV